MKHFFLLLLFTFFIAGILQAQSFSCGTRITPEVVAFENSYGKAAYTVPDLCLKKVISLYIHITKDSVGNTNIPLSEVNAAIDTLNKDFKPICLSFKICKIDYIDNWKYDTLNSLKDQTKEENEIRILYNVPKAINVYLVRHIAFPVGAAGYAPLPGGASPPANPNDVIVIKKSAVKFGVVFSHEFGHFFGLYHTFETKFGFELANESNCATAGDKLCDTEADINPVTMVGCQYTGNDKDAMGNYYTPPIGNIMSYHPCKCKFTVDQYNKMANIFLTYRNYLY